MIDVAKAETLLKEWQERLFLQAWRIKLRPNCKADDMALPECWGCSDWTEESKVARIDIVDPNTISEKIIEFDFEKTLVHELLHLKFTLLSSNQDDKESRYVHQLIDEMARAFVDAKRSEKEAEDRWRFL